MSPANFVDGLRRLKFENAFNPYSERCPMHDIEDAPKCRSGLLLSVLKIATREGVDAVWVGRDLGHRGGRRTGLAFTDDAHLSAFGRRWGVEVVRPTKGEIVRERTASVVWQALAEIEKAVFLWNVFPLHSHREGNPFSNRAHNRIEGRVGEEYLAELVALMQPRLLVGVGTDAERAVRRIGGEQEVVGVRHPSYGGQATFLRQAQGLSR